MCKSRQVGGEGSLARDLKYFALKIDPSSLASEYFFDFFVVGACAGFLKF